MSGCARAASTETCFFVALLTLLRLPFHAIANWKPISGTWCSAIPPKSPHDTRCLRSYAHSTLYLQVSFFLTCPFVKLFRGQSGFALLGLQVFTWISGKKGKGWFFSAHSRLIHVRDITHHHKSLHVITGTLFRAHFAFAVQSISSVEALLVVP